MSSPTTSWLLDDHGEKGGKVAIVETAKGKTRSVPIANSTLVAKGEPGTKKVSRGEKKSAKEAEPPEKTIEQKVAERTEALTPY